MDEQTRQRRDTQPKPGRTLQGAYLPYRDSTQPRKKTPSRIPLLLGGLALLPIFALLYFFYHSDAKSPIVEKEEVYVSDASASALLEHRSVIEARILEDWNGEDTLKPTSPSNRAPSSVPSP